MGHGHGFLKKLEDVDEGQGQTPGNSSVKVENDDDDVTPDENDNDATPESRERSDDSVVRQVSVEHLRSFFG